MSLPHKIPLPPPPPNWENKALPSCLNTLTAILKTRVGQRVSARLEGLVRTLRKEGEGAFRTIIEKYHQWDHDVLEGTEEADKRSGTFIL